MLSIYLFLNHFISGPLSLPGVTLKGITNLSNVALPTVDIQVRFLNVTSGHKDCQQ
jgi:hypothetical protein